jgi:maltose alpha-D-glucosyltransferase/alpha-amylase
VWLWKKETMDSYWYKDAVIYELDIRSFYDSNGDGVGDFAGLIDKLYYLQELGVTALVLGPPQPWLASGEHVLAGNHALLVSGRSGPVQGLECVIREAHARRMRVVIELFVGQMSGQTLNLTQVRRELLKGMRHWLDAGVDGVKVDGMPAFQREGARGGTLPESHTIVKEMREVIDGHYAERALLVETNSSPDDGADYFTDGNEWHMAFNLSLMPRLLIGLKREDRRPIVQILRRATDIPAECQWALCLRDHNELSLEWYTDSERNEIYEAYAPDPQMRLRGGIRRRLAPLFDNDRRRVELAYALMCSLPGSPVIYYGNEIGMGDNVYLDDCNGLRTPMQWSADRNAGFSFADPARLSVPVNAGPVYGYQVVNVEAQRRQPSSMLNWMRRLLAVRRQHVVFGRGSVEFLEPRNQTVLAFVRRHGDEQILVVANLSGRAQSAELSLSFYAGAQPLELLGGTRFRRIGADPYAVTLDPYDFFWLLLSRRAVRPTASSDFVAGVLTTRTATIEAPAAITGVNWERHDCHRESGR